MKIERYQLHHYEITISTRVNFQGRVVVQRLTQAHVGVCGAGGSSAGEASAARVLRQALLLLADFQSTRIACDPSAHKHDHDAMLALEASARP